MYSLPGCPSIDWRAPARKTRWFFIPWRELVNRIFRLVFNRRLGVVQVASEVASHRGGAARGAAPRRRAHPLAAAMSLVLAVPMFGTMSPALAQALINEGRTIDEDTTFATGVDIGSDSAGSVLVKDGAVVASGQLRLGVLADSHGSLVVQGPGRSGWCMAPVYWTSDWPEWENCPSSMAARLMLPLAVIPAWPEQPVPQGHLPCAVTAPRCA
jgi:Biotin carboxyl carrier protein